MRVQGTAKLVGAGSVRLEVTRSPRTALRLQGICPQLLSHQGVFPRCHLSWSGTRG